MQFGLIMRRKIQEFPSVLIKIEDLDGKFNATKIFGRPGRFHLEIGSGKGTFLVHQARACPDDNFLGIEWASRFYRLAVDKIGRWKTTNVRIIRTDATVFIPEFIPENFVDCFHIYFPDPWPKKRHKKRRFICDSNLEMLIKHLKPSGQIRIATDHEDYFEQITEVVGRAQDKLEEIDFIKTAGADTGEWVGSSFERKYLRQRKEIYTIALMKK